MSSRKRRDPAEIARQSMEKSERRRGFLEYIQAHDLPKNEQSAHFYAYTVTSSVSEKVNLVHELVEAMKFDELLTQHPKVK
jgi:hypothetical protein